METKQDNLEYESLQTKRWNGIMYSGPQPDQSNTAPGNQTFHQQQIEKYGFSEATALYCGVMQIVFGLCFISVGIGCLFLNTCMSIICLGIWGGVFFIIAGSLGISTVYRGGRRYVIVTIVFCFISVMIAAAAIVCGGIALALDFSDSDVKILCPRIFPTSAKAARGKIAMDILYIVFAGCEILATITQALNCYSRNITLHRIGCPQCKHCKALKILLTKKRMKASTARSITVPKSRANVYVVPEPEEPEVIQATKAPTPVKQRPPIVIEETQEERSEPPKKVVIPPSPKKGQLVLDENTIDTLRKNKQQVLVLPIMVPMNQEKGVQSEPPSSSYHDDTIGPVVSPIQKRPHYIQPQPHKHQSPKRTPPASPQHAPIFWGQPITLDRPYDPDRPITADTIPLDKMIQAEQQRVYTEPMKRQALEAPQARKPVPKKYAAKQREMPHRGTQTGPMDGELEEQEQSLDITDRRSVDSFDAQL